VWIVSSCFIGEFGSLFVLDESFGLLVGEVGRGLFFSQVFSFRCWRSSLSQE
jgi:hypothetical protein